MNFGDLRAILRYVPQFQRKTFVIAVDGEVLDSDHASTLLADLAVLRSLGVRVAFVFGAAAQTARLGAERGISLSRTGETGPTDAATLEVARDAVERVTVQLTRTLSTLGIRVVSSNLLDARALGIVEGVEQGFSGRIYNVDSAAAHQLLDQGVLLLPPLGFDRRGTLYWLQADRVATDVAIALRASKLIFAVREERVPFADAKPRQLTVDELRDWLGSGEGERSDPRVLGVLRYAARACGEGVARSHVLAGEREEALLAELFSNEGVGTMVHADVYRTMRKATITDLDAILAMTTRAVEDGQLVARSRSELMEQLDEFWVLEVDGNLVGCVALHLYPDCDSAEVAALYVRTGHVGRGYGTSMLSWLEKKARELGKQALFAYTTQATGYFSEHRGFFELSDDSNVPETRREQHRQSGRGSRLFWKALE